MLWIVPYFRCMKHLILACACLTFGVSMEAQYPMVPEVWYDDTDAIASALFQEALGQGECHERLRELTKGIGHRLSGSPQADSAMVWGANVLENNGADSVFVMPVVVPAWTRGDVCLASAGGDRLRVTALGGSVPTPGDSTIRARCVVVRGIEELAELPRSATEGRIVLFNRPMDPLLINTGAAYGGAVDQRGKGAIAAAKAGGVAALVRSMTHAHDTIPHTGAMYYEDDVPRVPAAAISTVDARELAHRLEADPDLELTLAMNCRDLGEREQGNVIGVLSGNEFPERIIALGGHLDSWDIGEGAHDDGAGIVHTLEALRLLRAIGYAPRHTLHFVLFINEENGNRGGEAYAQWANNNEMGLRVVGALESDAGGLVPRGFSIDASPEDLAWLNSLLPYLEPFGLNSARNGWAGVDISPLKQQENRPLLLGLLPDGQRYFDYHHSARDVFENVHKRELELGAAACALMIVLMDQHL